MLNSISYFAKINYCLSKQFTVCCPYEPQYKKDTCIKMSGFIEKNLWKKKDKNLIKFKLWVSNSIALGKLMTCLTQMSSINNTIWKIKTAKFP